MSLTPTVEPESCRVIVTHPLWQDENGRPQWREVVYPDVMRCYTCADGSLYFEFTDGHRIVHAPGYWAYLQSEEA